MFKLISNGITSILLAAGISMPVAALDFYFDGYGGFTDPEMANPSPTPADGADSNSTEDFEKPILFNHLSNFDPDINAFGSFEWRINQAEHSHLTINELNPDMHPPGDFADPVRDSVTVNDLNGSVVGWLIHHNEVLISTSFGPDNLSVHYHVDVYEDDARTGLLFHSGPMDFTLDVMETRNEGAHVNGLCLDDDGGLAGNDTGFATPCPDRFRVASGWPVNPVSGGESFDRNIGNFRYRGVLYHVFMSGFWHNDNLVGEAWSAENQHQQFDVRVRVVTAEIPLPGCLEADKEKLTIKATGNSRWKWNWKKGAATTKADFGNPLTDTYYTVCIYDGAGDEQNEPFCSTVPPGNGWNEKNGWKVTNKGYKFRSKAGVDGIEKIMLKEGSEGKAKIMIKGVDAEVSLPLSKDVVIQISNSHGQCWDSRFSTFKKNDEDKFKAK